MKTNRGHYGFFKGRLGLLIMASTSRGLCLLQWEKKGALQYLARAFPEKNWVEKKSALISRARDLEKFLSGGRKFVPSLDLRGTSFQRKVWKALERIPMGKTVSYRKLAGDVGRPLAVRAVANACGQNPVAVAVPCHRVIRTDGTLGGYSAGIWRKKFLLKLERKI